MRRFHAALAAPAARQAAFASMVALLAACSSSIPNTGGDGTSQNGTESPNQSDDAAGASMGDDAASASDDATPASDDAGGNPTSGGEGGSPTSPGATDSGTSDSGNGTGTGGVDGGTGGPPPGGGNDAGSPPGQDAGPGPSTVTFTQVFNTVLSPVCASCHGNDVPNMSFASKSTAYTDLVGVSAQGTSCSSSGEKRVVASSSATSLLYMKVAGTQPCGARMPKNKPALSQANITLIKSWIDDGAQND